MSASSPDSIREPTHPDLHTILAPRPLLQCSSVDGELIVFDPASRRFHHLNPTAAAVWEELDGERTLQDVAKTLAAAYDTDEETVQNDVRALAAEFESQHLVESSDPPPVIPPAWVPALKLPRSDLRNRFRSLASGSAPVAVGPFDAFAFRFELACDDLEIGSYLSDVLAPLADAPVSWPDARAEDLETRTYVVRKPTRDVTAPDEELPGDWRLSLDGVRVYVNSQPSSMTDNLFWHVNRMAVETDSAHSMFHAAGASWGGVGVLMPGQQNAGKSTLVTGLVAAGLGYLGDEAVALDAETAWMLPFHKSIGLDRGSWPLFPEFEPDRIRAELQPNRWHVPPDRVRPGSRAPSAPVRYIVCPQYQQDAATTLEPMKDIDTVAILLEQAFHLADRPDALDQLVGVVEAADCYRLTVSNLADSVRLVCELVGAPVPEP